MSGIADKLRDSSPAKRVQNDIDYEVLKCALVKAVAKAIK